jgi:hypothetical protein
MNVIELRWLTRTRMIPGYPPMPDSEEDESMLQYRQKSIKERHVGYDLVRWTEWTDVPEVKLTETGE